MNLNPKNNVEIVTAELIKNLNLGVDQAGSAIAIKESDKNPEAVTIITKSIKKPIINKARELGFSLSRRECEEIQNRLIDTADASGNVFEVHVRVKETENGCIIDMGDESQRRIIVENGKVSISDKGCDTLFIRSSSTCPFVMPTPFGDIKKLLGYLNMCSVSAWVLITWIIYTLSTGREGPSVFPALVMTGGRGTSKTTIGQIILRSLVDPSALGVQGFPTDRKDMVIASNHASVLFYDNLRYLSVKWSDILCIAVTGGNDPTRKLYSDGDLVVHKFKVPLVLNGIHDFISEPDLTERCVFIGLDSIPADKRVDLKELTNNFNNDLPKIFRGVLDLLAKVLEIVDTVEVTHPQRMIRFTKYLAAVEQVMELEKSSLQSFYAESLNERQCDAVLDDVLGAHICAMVKNDTRSTWKGTAAELLEKILSCYREFSVERRKLPSTPSALSKSLRVLKPGLLTQDVDVEFSRGKHRTISITNLEDY